MPKFRVKFIPRGSWEVVVEAPNAKEAENLADIHFDMRTRASDAEWEIEDSEETDEPAEFFYEDDDYDEEG